MIHYYRHLNSPHTTDAKTCFLCNQAKVTYNICNNEKDENNNKRNPPYTEKKPKPCFPGTYL